MLGALRKFLEFSAAPLPPWDDSLFFCFFPLARVTLYPNSDKKNALRDLLGTAQLTVP